MILAYISLIGLGVALGRMWCLPLPSRLSIIMLWVMLALGLGGMFYIETQLVGHPQPPPLMREVPRQALPIPQRHTHV